MPTDPAPTSPSAPALHPGFRMILPYLRPIERFILDPDISEIMLNSPTDIFIEKQGVMEKVEGITIPTSQLRVAVQNVARSLGDDISEEKPILDSRLPDGSRIAAVLPPCSIHGITLTIRKFNTRSFTVQDLVRIGTITEAMAALLKNAIIERKNILISGGTGTGKTTLLNILADFIPDEDRLVVIEDTAEIHIRKPGAISARSLASEAIPPLTTPINSKPYSLPISKIQPRSQNNDRSPCRKTQCRPRHRHRSWSQSKENRLL